MKHGNHHCYFVPFYVPNQNIGEIQILIGQKVLYSDQQGFIMSNPKQWVISGGVCGDSGKVHNKNYVYNKAVEEFVEETGLDIIDFSDKSRLRFEYSIPQGYRDSYVCYFFEVNTSEYEKMNIINREKTDKYFYELETIKWVNLDIALELMKKDNIYNGAYKTTNEDALSYIMDYKERRKYWRTKHFNIEKMLRDYNYLTPYSPSVSFEKLFKIYKEKDVSVDESYVKYFSQFMDSIIIRKSYTDWFYDGILEFRNSIDVNGITILGKKYKKTILRNIMKEATKTAKIPTTIEEVIAKKIERGETLPVIEVEEPKPIPQKKQASIGRWKARKQDISLPSKVIERKTEQEVKKMTNKRRCFERPNEYRSPRG